MPNIKYNDYMELINTTDNNNVGASIKWKRVIFLTKGRKDNISHLAQILEDRKKLDNSWSQDNSEAQSSTSKKIIEQRNELNKLLSKKNKRVDNLNRIVHLDVVTIPSFDPKNVITVRGIGKFYNNNGQFIILERCYFKDAKSRNTAEFKKNCEEIKQSSNKVIDRSPYLNDFLIATLIFPFYLWFSIFTVFIGRLVIYQDKNFSDNDYQALRKSIKENQRIGKYERAYLQSNFLERHYIGAIGPDTSMQELQEAYMHYKMKSITYDDVSESQILLDLHSSTSYWITTSWYYQNDAQNSEVYKKQFIDECVETVLYYGDHNNKVELSDCAAINERLILQLIIGFYHFKNEIVDNLNQKRGEQSRSSTNTIAQVNSSL